jgi:hypothetical protein
MKHMIKPALALLLTAGTILGLSACDSSDGTNLTYSQASKQISKQFDTFGKGISASDKLSTLKYTAQQSKCDAKNYSESVQQVTYVSKSFDLKQYLTKTAAAAKKDGFSVDSNPSGGNKLPGSTVTSLKKGGFAYQVVTLTKVTKKDVKTNQAVLFAATGPCVVKK